MLPSFIVSIWLTIKSPNSPNRKHVRTFQRPTVSGEGVKVRHLNVSTPLWHENPWRYIYRKISIKNRNVQKMKKSSFIRSFISLSAVPIQHVHIFVFLQFNMKLFCWLFTCGERSNKLCKQTEQQWRCLSSVVCVRKDVQMTARKTTQPLELGLAWDLDR